MIESQVSDLSTELKKNLEKQLKEIKHKGNCNPIATHALETFDKVYKSQLKEKSPLEKSENA